VTEASAKWGHTPIRKSRPSLKDALAEEAERVAGEHERLKREFLERDEQRKAAA
jgi:hypothetical protein